MALFDNYDVIIQQQKVGNALKSGRSYQNTYSMLKSRASANLMTLAVAKKCKMRKKIWHWWCHKYAKNVGYV